MNLSDHIVEIIFKAKIPVHEVLVVLKDVEKKVLKKKSPITLENKEKAILPKYERR